MINFDAMQYQNLLRNYDLFLFDFDGLLVDTEALHFEAYQKTIQARGWALPWSWSQYCQNAHLSATSLRQALYKEFPPLQEEPWETFYAEKKSVYQDLLHKGKLGLMPGVKTLLQELHDSGKEHCVVTHSPRVQVEMIRSFLPELGTIPHWFTREDYQEPKPSPECYQTALQRLQKEGMRAVGFEDTPKGLRALLGNDLDRYLISEVHSASSLDGEFRRVPSFKSLVG